MDISEFYSKVAQTHSELVASKARGERPWEGDDFVWLVSQNQTDLGHAVGGKDGAAVMVLLQDRSGNKRAALLLNEPGKPFRLSTPGDLEPQGPIFELKRIESENLALRRASDARVDKSKNFFVRVPGEE